MSKYSSSAKVVDGSLVLSLPDAVTPVVMRISLEEAKSAAFTVLEKKDQHVLTVQFSETKSRDIAPFAERENAVNALMAASAALEKGSKVYSSHGGGSESDGGGVSMASVGKWAAAIGVLLFLVWLIGQMGSGLPRAPLPANLQASANGSGSASPSNAGNVTGAPVSADDFLSRAN